MLNKKLYAMLLLVSMSIVTGNAAAVDSDVETSTAAQGGARAPRRGIKRASAARRAPLSKKAAAAKRGAATRVGTSSATYTPKWLPQPAVATGKKAAVKHRKVAARSPRKVRDGRKIAAEQRAACRVMNPVLLNEKTQHANAMIDGFIEAFKGQSPDFKAVTSFLEQFNSPEEIQAVLACASQEKTVALMMQIVELVSPLVGFASMFAGAQPQQGSSPSSPMIQTLEMKVDPIAHPEAYGVMQQTTEGSAGAVLPVEAQTPVEGPTTMVSGPVAGTVIPDVGQPSVATKIGRAPMQQAVELVNAQGQRVIARVSDAIAQQKAAVMEQVREHGVNKAKSALNGFVANLSK